MAPTGFFWERDSGDYALSELFYVLKGKERGGERNFHRRKGEELLVAKGLQGKPSRNQRANLEAGFSHF